MIPRDKKKVIQLRVSEELRKSIEYYADNANETISDYIRKAVETRMDLPVSKPQTLPFPVTPNNLKAAETLCSGGHSAKPKEEFKTFFKK